MVAKSDSGSPAGRRRCVKVESPLAFGPLPCGTQTKLRTGTSSETLSYAQGMRKIRFGAILLGATLVTAQDASSPKAAKSRMLEPSLPLVDRNGCPGKGQTIPHFRIERADRLYSTWQNKRVLVSRLEAGEEVTILAGLNIIREPDRARVINRVDQPAGLSLNPSDVVLVYGINPEGDFNIWGKRAWFTESCERVVAKGSTCGFADKTQCTIAITKNGIQETWLQVGTRSGGRGWVLKDSYKGEETWTSVNFGSVCGCD